MPPLPSPGQYVKVILKGTNSADNDVVNRLFFGYTTLGSQAQNNALATAIATAWNTRLAGDFHTTFTLVEVEVEDLQSSPASTGIWTGSHPGTLSGSPLSGGTAVCISNNINRRYRGGKSRTYLQAFDGSHLDTATAWNVAALATLLTHWQSFISDVATYNVSPVVMQGQANISYYHGFTNFLYPSGRYKAIPTPRVSPIVDNVVSHSANPAPASQRRRNKTP